MLGGDDRRKKGAGKLGEWARLALLLGAAVAVYSSHRAVRAALAGQGELLAQIAAHNGRAAAEVPTAARQLGEQLDRLEGSIAEAARATEGRLSEAVSGGRSEVAALAALVGQPSAISGDGDGAAAADGTSLSARLAANRELLERAIAALDAQAARLSALEELARAPARALDGSDAPAASQPPAAGHALEGTGAAAAAGAGEGSAPPPREGAGSDAEAGVYARSRAQAGRQAPWQTQRAGAAADLPRSPEAEHPDNKPEAFGRAGTRAEEVGAGWRADRQPDNGAGARPGLPSWRSG